MNLGIENEQQEFKEGLAQLDKGIKSLTAMLNRCGTGTVFFGVDDNGNVKGLDIGKKTLMDVRNRIKDLVAPQILAEITDCTDETGKHYIKVQATGSDIPYSCDDRYYVRNVSADESVPNEMLRKMLASGDTDLIRQLSAPEQDLTFSRMIDILSGRGIHVRDTEAFYGNYGLLNRENKYNFMAYLLSDQNNISIKVVRFEGDNKSVLSERTEFGKQCLLRTVRQVLDYFQTINTVRVNVSQGVRKETPFFTYEAFREAWVNACLHNAWNEQIPPSVYIFDDRIEIVSYGGLPYGLSKEGFYSGTSIPVNKSLLTIFIAAGYAEQSGHGVPIIVSSYGEKAFSFDDGLLKVTIGLNFESECVAARKAREQAQTRLTLGQRKVYSYLARNPSATLQETSEASGLSLGGVKKIISKLRKLNLLKREGSKQDGKWIVDFVVDFERPLK